MPTFVRLSTSRRAVHAVTVERTPLELVSFINGAQPSDHLTFVGLDGNIVVVQARDLSSADFNVVKKVA